LAQAGIVCPSALGGFVRGMSNSSLTPPDDILSQMPALHVEIVRDTHPMQLAALSVGMVLNVLGLVLLNWRKRRDAGREAGIPWASRKYAYWTLILASVSFSYWLDVHFAISPLLVPVKAYVSAFSLGLLDLHFSSTTGVPLKVVAGAALWCSCIYFRWFFINSYFAFVNGNTSPPLRVLLQSDSILVTEFSLAIVGREAFRFVVGLPLVGILSDLIFSPLHRLAHHPRLYHGHHKSHHDYTTKLTALVLYHGALLDDFLMPFTTSVGGALYVILLSLFGLQGEAFSSLQVYLLIFNTLLSHAHDTRCARLLAPLPDDLNFVAYHYVHHLSPTNNYGLTKPSDMFWDRLLGVDTIRKLEDLEEMHGQGGRSKKAR